VGVSVGASVGGSGGGLVGRGVAVAPGGEVGGGGGGGVGAPGGVEVGAPCGRDVGGGKPESGVLLRPTAVGGRKSGPPGVHVAVRAPVRPPENPSGEGVATRPPL